ncbi:MAG: hypothetical protein AAFO88_11135, partial [Pseudomonadota bacterium]
MIGPQQNRQALERGVRAGGGDQSAWRAVHVRNWPEGRLVDTYEYFGHLSGKFVEPYTFGQRAYAYLKRRRGDYDVILDNQTLASGILKVQDILRIPVVGMVHHPITRDRQLALEAAPDR